MGVMTASKPVFTRAYEAHEAEYPGGIFLMSMCGPVDRKAFAWLYPGQLLTDKTIYVPASATLDCTEIPLIRGQRYLPTPHVEHWTGIMKQLRRLGFAPMLIRFSHCTAQEPVSSLNVAFRVCQ